mmetsp:Transcript_32811/g.79831  ORF Transcript_32811/g.79831 Transcript_32811/m.79831 type:complete len:357 (+) Transcript_32811:768-1838(+)
MPTKSNNRFKFKCRRGKKEMITIVNARPARRPKGHLKPPESFTNDNALQTSENEAPVVGAESTTQGDCEWTFVGRNRHVVLDANIQGDRHSVFDGLVGGLCGKAGKMFRSGFGTTKLGEQCCPNLPFSPRVPYPGQKLSPTQKARMTHWKFQQHRCGPISWGVDHPKSSEDSDGQLALLHMLSKVVRPDSDGDGVGSFCPVDTKYKVDDIVLQSSVGGDEDIAKAHLQGEDGEEAGNEIDEAAAEEDRLDMELQGTYDFVSVEDVCQGPDADDIFDDLEFLAGTVNALGYGAAYLDSNGNFLEEADSKWAEKLEKVRWNNLGADEKERAFVDSLGVHPIPKHSPMPRPTRASNVRS